MFCAHWKAECLFILPCSEVARPRGYKTWVQSQTQNKLQSLSACGHVSASSQSLRFILSMRMNSSFITSRPHCHRPEAFYQILTCLIWALWVHMTYLFTKCVTQSCDSPDWLIQYCLSSASSRVTETVSMKMPCGECFQKCFSANNMISLWLNTIIPIIVMIWLPNMTRYLQWRIIYRHLTLVTF